MGKEIDLLKKYPKTKRNLEERVLNKTEEDRLVARRFDRNFFDGERRFGYGGFNYDSKYWLGVVGDFRKYWRLTKKNSLLDVGCAKGFMMHDFNLEIPGINIKGVDISSYAILNSIKSMKKNVQVANAIALPFEDKSFDYVISINTIHNLNLKDCEKAIMEINRVSKKGAYIVVDAYSNDAEKERMFKWNLTAKTIMSVSEWKIFFKKCGYNGDYYWFIP
jgi:SAM-dependent methyltransferase